MPPVDRSPDAGGSAVPGSKSKRTVVFAWFGSEEAGGYGARYLVERGGRPFGQDRGKSRV